MNNPSQAQANAVLRVLNGTRKKITCTVTKPDGSKFEFQADYAPDIKWDENCRSYWLTCKVKVKDGGTYGDTQSYPAMQWEPGSILFCEENPQ